jgi:cell wall-associated NlpC family hydrolase
MFISKAVALFAATLTVFVADAQAIKYYSSPNDVQGAIKVTKYTTGGQEYSVWRSPAILDEEKPTVEGDKVVIKKGIAYAPESAPLAVKKVIWAGNKIAKTPYVWGGGHARWASHGYDCSGSVSYALRGGKLIRSPLTSGALMSWGVRGSGRWITVYANPGHVWMKVGGVAFDTSGAKPSRWQRVTTKETSGYTARRPANL